MEEGGVNLGLLGVWDSRIGGATYRGMSQRVEFNQRGERDARIPAKPRQNVASTFRWMGLTVWVLKSSGSVWRG